MEYLLDVQWADPVATAVRRVLSGLPAGVESRTAVVPTARHHSFTLLSIEDPTTLATIADAISAAGADVRIVASEAA